MVAMNGWNYNMDLPINFSKERQIQLQNKRRIVKTQERQRPLFITATKKGIGLQKECATNQLINYRSSLGKQVLKVSIDDPLKVKH